MTGISESQVINDYTNEDYCNVNEIFRFSQYGVMFI